MITLNSFPGVIFLVVTAIVPAPLEGSRSRRQEYFNDESVKTKREADPIYWTFEPEESYRNARVRRDIADIAPIGSIGGDFPKFPDFPNIQIPPMSSYSKGDKVVTVIAKGDAIARVGSNKPFDMDAEMKKMWKSGG